MSYILYDVCAVDDGGIVYEFLFYFILILSRGWFIRCVCVCDQWLLISVDLLRLSVLIKIRSYYQIFQETKLIQIVGAATSTKCESCCCLLVFGTLLLFQ